MQNHDSDTVDVGAKPVRTRKGMPPASVASIVPAFPVLQNAEFNFSVGNSKAVSPPEKHDSAEGARPSSESVSDAEASKGKESESSTSAPSEAEETDGGIVLGASLETSFSLKCSL